MTAEKESGKNSDLAIAFIPLSYISKFIYQANYLFCAFFEVIISSLQIENFSKNPFYPILVHYFYIKFSI